VNTVKASVKPSIEGVWVRPAAATVEATATQAQTAKEAIIHALHCPHDDITTCPNFTNVIAARLAGQPLEEAHPH
jgi:hypothetical protein